MAKRLMCIVLSVLMIMAVLPTGVVGAGSPGAALEQDSGSLGGTDLTLGKDLTLSDSLVADGGSGNIVRISGGYTIQYSGGGTNKYVFIANGYLDLLSSDANKCYIIAKDGCTAAVYVNHTVTVSGQTVQFEINTGDGMYANNSYLNIVAEGSAYGIIVANNSAANLKSGVVTVNSADAYAVYAENGGTVNISGGYFVNNEGSTLVGCESGGTVSITGGYFYGQDLAAVAAEIGPYVANGYALTTEEVSGTTYVRVVSATSTTYTITYNSNDGNGTTVTVPVVSVTSVNIASSDTFTYDGYTFSGWNTQEDGNGTSYTADTAYTITSNLTLYAQWTPAAAVPMLYGRSLSLGGKIGVNYYFSCTDVDTPTGYYVVFTFGSDSDATTQTVYLSESTKYNELYVATCSVPFYQMTDEITAKLYDASGKNVETYTGYSVYAYWQAVRSSYGSDSKLYEAVLGMLCYGTYGKAWTGRTLTDVEESALNTFSSGVSQQKSYLLAGSSTYGYTATGGSDKVSISPTLVLSDTCALKFIITGDDAASCTVTVDGSSATVKNDGENYYVIIDNILVQNWAEGHTITVTDTDGYSDEISGYSVISYAYDMVSAAEAEGWEDTTENSESLRNLLVGMYTYYSMTTTYLSSLS